MEILMATKWPALKAISIVALGIAQVLAVTSGGLAADLRVSPQTRRAHVIHHARAWLVRDYDGTSIRLRPTRATILRSYDGTIISAGRLDAYWDQRALPPRYLNGQPVRRAYIYRMAAY
jgi:hypothetical protein